VAETGVAGVSVSLNSVGEVVCWGVEGLNSGGVSGGGGIGGGGGGVDNNWGRGRGSDNDWGAVDEDWGGGVVDEDGSGSVDQGKRSEDGSANDDGGVGVGMGVGVGVRSVGHNGGHQAGENDECLKT
jgi:hypothetical protein